MKRVYQKDSLKADDYHSAYFNFLVCWLLHCAGKNGSSAIHNLKWQIFSR